MRVRRNDSIGEVERRAGDRMASDVTLSRDMVGMRREVPSLATRSQKGALHRSAPHVHARICAIQKKFAMRCAFVASPASGTFPYEPPQITTQATPAPLSPAPRFAHESCSSRASGLSMSNAAWHQLRQHTAIEGKLAQAQPCFIALPCVPAAPLPQIEAHCGLAERGPEFTCGQIS